MSTASGFVIAAMGRAYADAAALEETTQRFNREITAAGWTVEEFMDRAKALGAAAGVSAEAAAAHLALNASEIASHSGEQPPPSPPGSGRLGGGTTEGGEE